MVFLDNGADEILGWGISGHGHYEISSILFGANAIADVFQI
jgi:hypothetical protein